MNGSAGLEGLLGGAGIMAPVGVINSGSGATLSYATGSHYPAPDTSNFKDSGFTLYNTRDPGDPAAIGVMNDANSWWGSMIKKYGLPPASEYVEGRHRKSEPYTNPTQQQKFVATASPEDLKQYYKYDVQLKSYFGASPFLPDPQDYGAMGRDWFDPGASTQETGLPNSPEFRQTAISRIDALTPQAITESRPAFTHSFGTRFQGQVDDSNDDIVGDIGMGLWKAGATGVITGGIGAGLGALGSSVGGTLGSVIGSGAVTGAAGGAAGGALFGGDPLKGALLGAAGGFLVKDTGLGKWALDKAKGALGYTGTDPNEAVSLLADSEGVPPGKIVEEGGQAVYGNDTSIGDLTSSGKVGITDSSGLDITADFNKQIANHGNDFAVDWTTGEVVPTGPGTGGLADHILGPEAALGPGSALVGTDPGVSPESPGGSSPTGGGSSSPTGGEMSIEDWAKLGITAVQVGGKLYNSANGEQLYDDLAEGAKRAADRADPWAKYRGQYGDALDAFMQNNPLQLPQRPNLTNPIDYAAAHPFTTGSGLQQFLDYTPTPIEVGAANPFESQSGLYDLLKNPDSITESPAYQFRLNQGLEALDRQLGASGKRFSGNRMLALNDYAQQAASQEYENEYARRGDYYDKEFNNYSFDMSQYAQDYAQEGALRGNMYGMDQNQYQQDMTRYGQNYNNIYDLYGQDYTRALLTQQQQYNQLAQLAGVTNSPNLGANSQQEGDLVRAVAPSAEVAGWINALSPFLAFLKSYQPGE